MEQTRDRHKDLWLSPQVQNKLSNFRLSWVRVSFIGRSRLLLSSDSTFIPASRQVNQVRTMGSLPEVWLEFATALALVWRLKTQSRTGQNQRGGHHHPNPSAAQAGLTRLMGNVLTGETTLGTSSRLSAQRTVSSQHKGVEGDVIAQIWPYIEIGNCVQSSPGPTLGFKKRILIGNVWPNKKRK